MADRRFSTKWIALAAVVSALAVVGVAALLVAAALVLTRSSPGLPQAHYAVSGESQMKMSGSALRA